ncbi:hypothetical protein P9293_09850 [Bacillus inaquosorum]|uniref:hypothetical protein n=1 Tax=Bacillus inaquosorum TaxID=483913 RepID=UPI0003820425|nr:hypothetical protein [Bacillus inaquosorum]MEC2062405.1 hypothetical protein [Bacillus inaquosorum]MEC2085602.1 hypothetical protein [Bacillus inaquosorum]MED4647728.1 hypothetical protein [Bacillus inaquosorum]MED4793040.1 hypothetical protein [Bacillus inaquosorum]
MKSNIHKYQEITKKIETELHPIAQNDNDLLSYLMKQDSLTLNQMKVCLIEPQLTFKHTVKIIFTVTLITLYIYFFSSHYNDLIEMGVQMFFVLIGLIWVFGVFPFSRKVQISERFKQKSENARIVGMIDFVLEQKYKKSISE